MQSIIKRTNVAYQQPAQSAPAPKNAADAGAPCDKSVQLLRVDGDVRAIELRCSCGEVTTIELQYENTGGQA